jgi:hypothetical protein
MDHEVSLGLCRRENWERNSYTASHRISEWDTSGSSLSKRLNVCSVFRAGGSIEWLDVGGTRVQLNVCLDFSTPHWSTMAGKLMTRTDGSRGITRFWGGSGAGLRTSNDVVMWRTEVWWRWLE